MTDREYLELAAKAAGVDIEWQPCGWAHDNETKREWNPIDDDGDALRLAVKLRIHVRHFPNDVEAQIGLRYWQEDDGTDPYAATRRAIVRAAAEIGRSMT